MAVAVAPAARATVVTFDDLTGTGGVLQNGYGGIDWGGEWYYGTGIYTPESTPNYAYVPVSFFNWSPTFGFANPEVFQGAYFSGATDGGGNAVLSVQLALYSDNSSTPVWTSGLLPVTGSPVFLESGYTGMVENVQVRTFYTNTTTSAPDFWVMDNVVCVPVPPAMLLLASGLVGLAAARKKTIKFSPTASSNERGEL